MTKVLRFLLKKLGLILLGMWALSLVSFFLIRFIPGDPVLVMLGERGGSEELYQAMKASLGLDQSLLQQYWIFVGKAIRGDFGSSVVTRNPVWSEFWQRFPTTIELGLSSVFWASLVGIPLGIIAALKRNTILDYFTMFLTLIGHSLPIFWWGLVMILIFSVQLELTPVSGRISVMYDVPVITGFLTIDSLLMGEGFLPFLDVLRHLLLPAFVCGTIPMASIARITRSSMLEVLAQDFMRTVKAKGASPWRLVVVHGLRNALIPIITVIGLSLGSVLTGAILTETIFSLPGVGKWIVESVAARDYPVIQSVIIFLGTTMMFINLAVDGLYYLCNPRLR